jgi:hypothetical protein
VSPKRPKPGSAELAAMNKKFASVRFPPVAKLETTTRNRLNRSSDPPHKVPHRNPKERRSKP